MTADRGLSRAARPGRALLAIAALVAVVAAFLVWGPAGDRGNLVVADTGVLLASLLAATAFTWRAVRTANPLPWWLLAAGLGMFGAAEAYSFFVEVVVDGEVGAVTVADGLYYLGYASLLAAMVALFPKRSTLRDRWCRVVDVVMLGAGLFAIAWILFLHNSVAHGAAPAPESIVAGAYPVLDLAVGAVLLMLARELTGVHRTRVLYLGLGLLVWTLADAVYAAQVLLDRYVSGLPLDALWIGGYLLFALGAVSGPRRDEAPHVATPAGLLSSNWTYGTWVVLLPLAAYHYVTGHGIDAVLLVTGMVLVSATAVRHTLFASDLLKAYGRLEARERLMKEAQALAKVGNWEYSFRDGHVAWSDETYRIFGVDPGTEPLDREGVLARIHSDDVEAVDRALKGAVEAGVMYAAEFRLLMPDGTVKHLQDRGDVVIENGVMVGAIGTSQDITEQKTADQNLRESQERLHNLLDNMDECFYSADLSDPQNPRILYVSKSFEAIFGRRADELYSNPLLWLEAAHPDDHDTAMATFQGLFDARGSITAKFRIIRPDDAVRWVVSFGHPVRDSSGVVVRVDGLIRDVTAEIELIEAEKRAREQQDETERLREMDDLKTTFLNTAAHELATPLTPIKIQLSILNGQRPGDAGLALLTRNIGRLERLVRDLLDASRLQAGRLTIHAAPYRVDQVMRDALESARMHANKAGITLQESLQGDMMVEVDELRICQVINKLLDNAIKFTPAGGTIRVSARDEGETVRIDVADSGAGMEPGQLASLFRPFHQVHDAKMSPHEGTGLGLFISRGIVERHGGTISVSSGGSGRGSTFTLHLPKPAKRSPTGAKLSEPDAAGQPTIAT